MADALGELADLVRERSGIRLRPSQNRSLTAALRRIGHGDPARALEEISDPVHGAELVDELVDELTIKETFFFREPAQLERIDWHGLLMHARGAAGIRAWSAACATGEEPYTLALLANEALNGDQAPLTVVGSDVSRSALRVAEQGRYGPRAVRLLEPRLLDRYFRREGKTFVPRPLLRRAVTFVRHNLARAADPPEGGGFDLIVCRNVLIYLEPRAVEHAVALMRAALAPGGTLLLGTADRLCAPQAPGPAGEAERRRGDRRQRRRSASPPDERRDRSKTDRRRRERRAPGPHPAPSLARALAEADAGDLAGALATTAVLLAVDPMDSAALYVRGLVELVSGEPAAAVSSLRSAKYADPDFALAAFTLGRAHDVLGDAAAARRAYEQALRSFDPDLPGPPQLLGVVDVGDLAGACRARLAALTAASP